MKKFLIFLVAIVVVVCVGLTTYYFMRNDEVINFTTKEIYCNVNDIIPNSELGFTVRKQSKKTTYNYNAAGDEVTNIIEYDAEKGYYKAKAGGDVEVVITTSNSKFPEFRIKVHIGDGKPETPYNIFNQADLNEMKSAGAYGLDGYYVLRKDITLTGDFQPIGYDETVREENWKFQGNFDGAGHTISGLDLTNEEGLKNKNAGLFAEIGADATITNLVISNVTINGEYAAAGALTGASNGKIDRVRVVSGETQNSVVSSSLNDAFVGALIGKVENKSLVQKSYAEHVDVTSNGVAGGLIGRVNSSNVKAVYTRDVTVNGDADSVLGGLVGNFVISRAKTTSDLEGSILQSYSTTTSENANFYSFIGKLEAADNTVYALLEPAPSLPQESKYENPKLKYLVGNYVGAPDVTSASKGLVNYSGDELKNYIEEKLTDVETNGNLSYDTEGFYLITKITVGQLKGLQADSAKYYGDETWDETVWNFPQGELPTLKMTEAEITPVTIGYINKSLGTTTVTGKDGVNGLETLLKNKIENKRLDLGNNTFDMSNVTINPATLTNSIIEGGDQGATISNLTVKVTDGNIGVFGTVTNSTIKNVKFENIKFETATGVTITNAGGVAGELTATEGGAASSIENVSITFAEEINFTANNFGGIAGVINNGRIINCTVGSAVQPTAEKANNGALTIAATANISNVGGVVATITSGSISGNTVYSATLYANNNVAGLVAINNGAVGAGNFAKADIRFNKGGFASRIAGLVAQNNGTINQSSAEVSITILAATSDASNVENNVMIGGVAAINNGEITQVAVSGEGVKNDSTVAATTMFIGGVVALNNANGTITDAQNNMAQVGMFTADKNYEVAGIVAINYGAITKATATSSAIEGNVVAGVVAEMLSGSIDQVFVGSLTTTTNDEGAKSTAINRNTIKGDTYVAGVVVSQDANTTISNIQATSVVTGANNKARVSLVALIFPDGAVLSKATIDSTLVGSAAAFYRDTWKDADAGRFLGAYWLDQEDGIQAPKWGYNLYANDAASGTMRSVFVNTENISVSYVEADVISYFYFGYQYDMDGTADERKSFVISTNAAAFRNRATFTSQVSVGGRYTFTPEFSIGQTNSNASWVENNGIILNYVQRIIDGLNA